VSQFPLQHKKAIAPYREDKKRSPLPLQPKKAIAPYREDKKRSPLTVKINSDRPLP
jgi:hypothetical protein